MYRLKSLKILLKESAVLGATIGLIPIMNLVFSNLNKISVDNSQDFYNSLKLIVVYAGLSLTAIATAIIVFSAKCAFEGSKSIFHRVKNLRNAT